MRKISVMLMIAVAVLWSADARAALVFNADFAQDGIYENVWPFKAGQVVTVDIYVSSVPAPGLISMGFKLTYDSSKLEVVTAATAVDSGSWPSPYVKMDVLGEIEMAGARLGEGLEGLAGDHIRLGTVTFRCIGEGQSEFKLMDRDGDWFVLDCITEPCIPIDPTRILDGDIGAGVLAATIRPAVPGDVNGDGSVDLADAILTIRKMALIHEGYLHANADCSGDGAIGLPEAIYVLQKISGWRN